MRFLADGPDIPDDLLDARDEGQVIFFCGAGVSQHEAGGPNFHQLAKLVVEDLGSARGSPARQLLDFAKGVQPIAGVGGMMPADRIFGLLEQEFPSIEVRRAVSRAIRPTADAGFGPHRSLIDLSRTPDGIVRLVTTNFDRIFEQAHPGLRTIDPPVLPDPARPGSLDGIIHLHGKVSLDYVAPESAEFVLSSADFGRAYLADGWATDFIRALMDRYRIVFVGYSADDPPVQYLLEALQPTSAPGRLYALQEGEASLAAGLWQHKGVTAIPFSGFQTLWDSLGAWAERARDPDGWRARIAAMATAGPRSLLPHERGQVANLVSSAIGAETFSRHEPAPPAEWVCVFDPYVRYDRVRPVDVWDAASSDFDPFESYGLDSDPPPRRSEDETMIEQREVPKASWSALEAIATDEPGGRAPAVQSVRGPTASHPPALPKRLFRLARWFGRVATDPIAIWWAAGQNALHPDMLKFAQRDVLQDGVDAAVRNAWRCISAALREPPSDAQDPWILQHAVAIEGWSTLSLQRLLEIERPRLVVLRPTTSPISTPEEARTLVYIDVAYSGHIDELNPPDDLLAAYVEGTRQNLLVATSLEEMAGGYALMNLAPLEPYETDPNEFVGTNPNLSTLMAHLAGLVLRLLDLSPDMARAHVASWRDEHGLPFQMLRVWAARDPHLLDAAAASCIMLEAAGQDWDGPHERDLMTALEARWSDLDLKDRGAIEQLLLAGPANSEGVEQKQFEIYHARSILRRLVWLQRKKIPVSFDLAGEIERYRALSPDRKGDEIAEHLDRNPNRGGMVRTDKSHSGLTDVPIDGLLEAAKGSSGPGQDFLVERRPFRGLVETRPNRALTALHRKAMLGEAWSSAWSDLFWSEARAKDRPRFRCLIARRIAQIPDAVLAESLSAATQWFAQNSKPIWHHDPVLFFATWDLLSGVAARHPAKAASSIVRTTRKDWSASAINSPPGKLADLLFRQIGWSQEDGQAAVHPQVERMTRLMDLPHPLACLAVSRITMHLNWLFVVAQDWTVLHLLPRLDDAADRDMQDAALAGLLRQHHLPEFALFIRLKPLLTSRLDDPRLPAEQQDGIAQLILHGWLEREAAERWVSSEELRDVLIHSGEGIRIRALRSLADWSERSKETADDVPEFLTAVWPRQLAVRTPAASAALADLALRSGENMPQVSQAVVPFLETTAEHVEALPRFRRADDEILARFPREHLDILFAILPEDPALWPWGMDVLMERFASLPELKSEPRLSELRRRVARS